MIGLHIGASAAWYPEGVGGIQIRLIEAGTLHAPALGPRGTVCSAYDQSVCADVGAFYRTNRSHRVQLGLVMSMPSGTGLRLRFTEGAIAPKAALRPRLQVGLITTHPLRSDRRLMLEAYTSLGGDIVHKPCVDAHDRRYFCASLTAWQDQPGRRVRSRDFGFRLALRF